MSNTITLDAGQCFEAELLGKDLASWLEAPKDDSWTPRFSTLEEWQAWWERGDDFLLRARDLYVFFSTVRQDAGIDASEDDLGPLLDPTDRFGLRGD